MTQGLTEWGPIKRGPIQWGPIERGSIDGQQWNE